MDIKEKILKRVNDICNNDSAIISFATKQAIKDTDEKVVIYAVLKFIDEINLDNDDELANLLTKIFFIKAYTKVDITKYAALV